MASLVVEQNVWLHLPDMLIQTVLRFSPAESVFKFRTICKKWHEILTDPNFLGAWLGAPHISPLCVLNDVPNKCYAVYNIGSDKWNYLRNENFLTGPFPAERIVITAAGAGLVLLEVFPEPPMQQYHFANKDVSGMANKSLLLANKSLLLVNPLNKSYWQLPDFENGDSDYVRCPKVVGIDHDPQSGRHQIPTKSTLFHIGELDYARPGKSRLHVYDVNANSWDMICDSSSGGGPEEWDKSYIVLGPAVLHGGSWYYLTYSQRFWGPRNRDAMPHIFRVKKGLAETLQAPLPQEMGMIVDFMHLFECQEKLSLVGSLKSKNNLILNEWTSFCFWLLDEEKSEWVDYLKMPLYLVNSLGDRRVKQFALDLECSVDYLFLGGSSSWEGV